MDYRTRYYHQDLSDQDESFSRLFAIPRPLPNSPIPRTSRPCSDLDTRLSGRMDVSGYEHSNFVQQQKYLIESRVNDLAESRIPYERMQRRGAISYPSQTNSRPLLRYRYPYGMTEPLPTLSEASLTQQQQERKRKSDAAQLEPYDGSQPPYADLNQDAYDTPRKKRRLSEQPPSSTKPFSPATSPLKHKRAHSAISSAQVTTTPLGHPTSLSTLHFTNPYPFPSANTPSNNPSPTSAYPALRIPNSDVGTGKHASGSTTSTPPKKHTRPPISSLFASLCLSSPDFIALQAAAKAFMLDTAHPERQACVGSKARTSGSSTATNTTGPIDAEGDISSSEAAKVRLGRVVRDFLHDEGAGERFWGSNSNSTSSDEMDIDDDAGAGAGAAPGQAKKAWAPTDSKTPKPHGRGARHETLRWPRDAEEIAARITPLCRRMVTNERQRQYAVETRSKNGAGGRGGLVGGGGGGGGTSTASSPIAARAAAVDLLRLARSSEGGTLEYDRGADVEAETEAQSVTLPLAPATLNAGARGLQRKRGYQDLKGHSRNASGNQRYGVEAVSPAKRRRRTHSVSSSSGSENDDHDDNNTRRAARPEKQTSTRDISRRTRSNSKPINTSPSKRPRLSEQISRPDIRNSPPPPPCNQPPLAGPAATEAGADETASLALVPHVPQLAATSDNSNGSDSHTRAYHTSRHRLSIQHPTTLRVTIVYDPRDAERAQTLLTAFTHPCVSYALLIHLLGGHAAERRMRVVRVAALGEGGLVDVDGLVGWKEVVKGVERSVWMEGVVRVVAFVC